MMDGFAKETHVCLTEIGGEEVGVLLGLHEDQSPLLGIALRILHQLLQLSALVKLGDLVEVLNKIVNLINLKKGLVIRR